jgi:hypothetical protein
MRYIIAVAAIALACLLASPIATAAGGIGGRPTIIPQVVTVGTCSLANVGEEKTVTSRALGTKICTCTETSYNNDGGTQPSYIDGDGGAIPGAYIWCARGYSVGAVARYSATCWAGTATACAVIQ